MASDRFEILLSHIVGLREIYISGGEPLEHPELRTLVEIARHHCNHVVIYSSGVQSSGPDLRPVSAGEAKSLLLAGVTRTDISLYSANQDLHDTVTATPGSWQIAVRTAATLINAGIDVGIHHVPIISNQGTIASIARLARDLGASRLHILALAAQGRGVLLGQAQLSKTWLEEVLELKSARLPLEIVLSSSIRRELGEVDETRRDQLKALFIDCVGYVYPGEGHRTAANRLTMRLTPDEANILLGQCAEGPGSA